MTRAKPILYLTSLCALAATGLALANASATKSDPRGDARPSGGPDLRSTTVSNTGTSLKFKVVQYNRYSAKHPPSVYLFNARSDQCRTGYWLLLIRAGKPNRNVYKPSPATEHGRFSVTFPDAHTVVFTVRRSLVGNPNAIKWDVSVPSSGESSYDILSNSGYALFRLG